MFVPVYVCICVLMTVCVCKMCPRLKYKAGEMYFNSSESLSEVLLPFKQKAPNQIPRFIIYLRQIGSTAGYRHITESTATSPEREKWRKIAGKREMSLLGK